MLLAAAAGAVIWLATGILTGEPEAWDSMLYWVAAYPVLILLAALLGYRRPAGAWRLALALVAPVPILNVLRWPSELPWLPLHLLAAALVALPLVAAAWVGAAAARRRAR